MIHARSNCLRINIRTIVDIYTYLNENIRRRHYYLLQLKQYRGNANLICLRYGTYLHVFDIAVKVLM